MDELNAIFKLAIALIFCGVLGLIALIIITFDIL